MELRAPGWQRRAEEGGRGITVLPGRHLTHVQRCEKRSVSRAVCQGRLSHQLFHTKANQNEQRGGEADGHPSGEGPGKTVPTPAHRGKGAHGGAHGAGSGGGEAAEPALWPQPPRSGAKKDEPVCHVPKEACEGALLSRPH